MKKIKRMAEAPDMNGDDGDDGGDTSQPPFIKDRRKDYANTILAAFTAFKQNGELTDIDILLSGGKKIACHRMLLAAASPYFKQALMFHEGARLTDLDLQAEADTDVMEAIINYIYSGRLNVPFHLLYELLRTTDFLQMTDVKEDCAEFLSAHVTPRLSLIFYTLSSRIGLRNLQYASLETITMYFPALVQEPELLDFDKDDMRTIFEQKGLQVTTEDEVLDLLIRWSLHDKKNRMQHFERLLQFVKIIYCSNTILTTIGGSKQPDNKKITGFITKRLRYLKALKDSKPESMPTIRDSVRCTSFFLVGGEEMTAYSGVSTPNLYIYSSERKPHAQSTFERTRTRLPWRDGSPTKFRASLLPYGILLTGGNLDGLSSTDVYLFEFRRHEWSALPRLITEREGHICAAHGFGAVFVASGLRKFTDNTQPGMVQTEELRSVDRLDLLERRWDRLPGAVPGRCTDGVICGDKFYLADLSAVASMSSGSTEETSAAKPSRKTTRPAPAPAASKPMLLECDLTTNRWQLRSHLPVRDSEKEDAGGCLVEAMGRLYLFRQYLTVTALWKYQGEDDSWTELTSLTLTPADYRDVLSDGPVSSAVFYGGGLYYCKDQTKDVKYYDIKTDSWDQQWDNRKLELPGTFSHCYLFAGSHFRG